jgi:threonine/homoserine/homoserine lactone efflux protein
MTAIISVFGDIALLFTVVRRTTSVMDPTAALIAGLVAGLAIAMQVGAVSLLLIEASVVRGPRVGVAAGMGVATADLAFAAVAAVAGGATGAALSSHETEIKVIAALALAAIALHGLIALMRDRSSHDAPFALEAGHTPAGHYARFLAITMANPLTIASFAAVAAALSLDGPASAVAFAAGVGAASAGWHVALTLAAGHAGRWMTPRIRRGLAIGGRIFVLAIALRLALGA